MTIKGLIEELSKYNEELGRVDGFRKVASGGIPKSVFL
jgi:hypothetical protein